MTAATDTIALLRRRRSAPPATLSGPGPGPAEVELLLALAARVPDHGKLVPWRFIVFSGDGRERAGRAIASVYAADHPEADAARLEGEGRRLSQAPLVVAVVSRAAPHVKIPEWEQVLSAGAATMNLVVAANALGFAATWITEWYAYDARVRSALGLGESERIAGFVHIGRPTALVEDRARPVMTDITTFF